MQLLLITLVLSAIVFYSTADESVYSFKTTNLPPRRQWGTNYGYCGEVSTVAAMLKYGQYMSQYDVRDVAVIAPRDKQMRWYSVGTNDQLASHKLKLTFEEFDCYSYKSTEDYYAWIKRMTRKGYAVTFCVFMNHYLFYGIKDETYGYHFYDHIVSISEIQSKYYDDYYHDDDIIIFSDHGLWSPDARNPPYIFNYTFSEFRGNRTDANKQDGRIYTMPDSPGLLNFGIAHKGVADDNNDLLPVTVTTNLNYEWPEPRPQSEERPTPMPLVLTITVSKLEDDVQYVLYKYDDEERVPTSQFNYHSKWAKNAWKFIGTAGKDFIVSENITSNQKCIYRAVRADAL